MHGSFVALITPFTNDYKFNEAKFIETIERQIAAKTDGLLSCGTTGETPALSPEEKLKVIELAVRHKADFQKVMAGSGTNNTEKTIEETKKIASIGVDYALVITPYYNKPNQEGLFRHFLKVLDESPIPVVLYNVPGRTGVNILPATIERFAKHEKLVAVKEASGNLMQISDLYKCCGKDLDVLSGDDGLTLPIMSIGAKGVVSVTANVIPGRIKAMIDSILEGNFSRALEIHNELLALNQVLFVESNPIPAKLAMNFMGLDVGPVRLPLGPASEKTKIEVKQVLTELELM